MASCRSARPNDKTRHASAQSPPQAATNSKDMAQAAASSEGQSPGGVLLGDIPDPVVAISTADPRYGVYFATRLHSLITIYSHSYRDAESLCIQQQCIIKHQPSAENATVKFARGGDGLAIAVVDASVASIYSICTGDQLAQCRVHDPTCWEFSSSIGGFWAVGSSPAGYIEATNLATDPDVWYPVCPSVHIHHVCCDPPFIFAPDSRGHLMWVATVSKTLDGVSAAAAPLTLRYDRSVAITPAGYFGHVRGFSNPSHVVPLKLGADQLDPGVTCTSPMITRSGKLHWIVPLADKPQLSLVTLDVDAIGGAQETPLVSRVLPWPARLKDCTPDVASVKFTLVPSTNTVVVAHTPSIKLTGEPAQDVVSFWGEKSHKTYSATEKITGIHAGLLPGTACAIKADGAYETHKTQW